MARRTTPQQPFAGWDKADIDLGNARWRSGSRGIGDVQIAFVEGFIAMRNAGRPASRPLVLTPLEWRAFVVNARHGEFDAGTGHGVV
ncbi:DUF397 domain-containing protein [Streptomyces sp. NBC_00464]|uniref:DUF397 domain-containing protein n=1 Tax=Streptomyces sp. NBC_00464 TaxID=2975751 RepID=UPI002E192EC6